MDVFHIVFFRGFGGRHIAGRDPVVRCEGRGAAAGLAVADIHDHVADRTARRGNPDLVVQSLAEQRTRHG